MLRHLLSLSRLFVTLAVGGILTSSVALLIYEASVIAMAVEATVADGTISPKIAKTLSVGRERLAVPELGRR
jgi:hypothetical protein